MWILAQFPDQAVNHFRNLISLIDEIEENTFVRGGIQPFAEFQTCEEFLERTVGIAQKRANSTLVADPLPSAIFRGPDAAARRSCDARLYFSCSGRLAVNLYTLTA